MRSAVNERLPGRLFTALDKHLDELTRLHLFLDKLIIACYKYLWVVQVSGDPYPAIVRTVVAVVAGFTRSLATDLT